MKERTMGFANVFGSLRLGLIVPFLAVTTPPACSADGRVIDLSGFEETFTEEFDTLDVSAVGPGTRWIAHTPWNGDFGDAVFTDPKPGFPFTTLNGKLRIEMRKDEQGRWRSGLLASVDPKMQGFSQRYGYFEMSAKMPPGEGVWPAFWLIGVNYRPLASEIDVIEYYGQFPDRYMASIAVWDKVGKPPKNYTENHRVFVPGKTLTDGFHTFGVEVDEQTTTFFLDRKAVATTPTRPEHRQPMYVLLNLGAGGGWPITNMPNPSIMEVDYVRVWQKRP